MDFRPRANCILCLSKNLNQAFELAPTPIANRLPISLADAEKQKEIRIPLTLLVCADCEHVQLREIVPPLVLFHHYPYMSVSNSTMKNRLQALSEVIIQESQAEENDAILEIGSNDGALLREFQKRGMRVLGIDPAKDVARKAQDSGVRTIAEFFSTNLVVDVIREIGIPKVIIANNVLAHTNELRDIVCGLSMLMENETRLYIEFSYLVDVLEKSLVDTIYHEHTSYHHLKPLHKLMKDFSLRIVDVHRFSAHGGSLRIQVVREESEIQVCKVVDKLLEFENLMNIGHLNSRTWTNFRSKTEFLSKKIKSVLQEEVMNLKPLPIGYGISAKFASLYYGLGLDSFKFAGFYDDNPLKVGRYVPGTLDRVRASGDLSPQIDQSILLFSWNYKEEVVSRMRRSGIKNKVIVPLPETEIIP